MGDRNMKWSIIILAIALILCLAPMPYGYFILVRYAAAIIFTVMAYDYYQQNKRTVTCLWIALAILFQPIFKIALGRIVWNVVDVVVAVLLLFMYVKRRE